MLANTELDVKFRMSIFFYWKMLNTNIDWKEIGRWMLEKIGKNRVEINRKSELTSIDNCHIFSSRLEPNNKYSFFFSFINLPNIAVHSWFRLVRDAFFIQYVLRSFAMLFVIWVIRAMTALFCHKLFPYSMKIVVFENDEPRQRLWILKCGSQLKWIISFISKFDWLC